MIRRRPDAGHATVLVIGATSVLLAGVVGLTSFGRHLCDAARARTAADAAALAAAHGDLGQSSAIARENGGTVTGVRVDGATVVVTVRVGVAEATARATYQP